MCWNGFDGRGVGCWVFVVRIYDVQFNVLRITNALFKRHPKLDLGSVVPSTDSIFFIQ